MSKNPVSKSKPVRRNEPMNNAMKFLSSITLIMAVPTVISGLYGMNVNAASMPFVGSSGAFGIVCGIILVVCIVAAWVLHKKHML